MCMPLLGGIQAMWNQYDILYHSPISSDQYERLTNIWKWPVMIAETVSLGILSLPSALAALGFLP